ncbi:ROK family transcriptional regulator [Wenxinia marina]|uniref:Transcriptional regulator/sugar kinase n=1 Tax=Wenxinia marina DSM 24838 TaxID=1123501 RepID=A0A0D0NHH9_9RHOB|nr:ROK family protein [Wenxinia marina]KIQ67780.1 Transcriptional regulator/sugar kinase [Wenxinia marina DSM 24838]GGL77298.1 sugar kinase [Wenxinia marina]
MPPKDAARPTARGKNPGRNREHNRRVVLDLMRQQGRTGRRELARLCQLTPQSVTNIIDDLIAENLILPAGRRTASGRGQPPLDYEINPDGAFTIGIELAVTRMTAVVVDLADRIRVRTSFEVADMSPAGALPRIEALVAELRAGQPGRLMGIGVVMPGPFEIEGFSGVGPTTLPGWAGIDAAAALTSLLGIPVAVENDANAVAIGETLLGAGRHLSQFGVIYFGTGIGLGTVSSGTLMRGAFGNAGEIGHIVAAPGGRPCPCGQQGCLERYASTHALRERLLASGRSGDLAELDTAHPETDPVLDAWLDEAAAHLAPVVSILENVLDPQTIILAGGLAPDWLDAIIARMRLGTSVARRSDRALPRVIRGQSGTFAAAIGAAALPMHEAVTPRLELSEVAPLDTERMEQPG